VQGLSFVFYFSAAFYHIPTPLPTRLKQLFKSRSNEKYREEVKQFRYLVFEHFLSKETLNEDDPSEDTGTVKKIMLKEHFLLYFKSSYSPKEHS